MKQAILYIHGKGGCAEEAEHYQAVCPEYDVVGLDYQFSTPWETKDEIMAQYKALRAEGYSVVLIANSIGAYFAMNALAGQQMERALFISPIVNMEKLISDMMQWAGVTEAELREKKEIETSFGETLSWKYLCYVREHPVTWKIPTDILYAQKDHLTSYDTVSRFANQISASLTVLGNGEHWFHTDEQMDFLDNWLKSHI